MGRTPFGELPLQLRIRHELWRSGGEGQILGVGEPCDATLEVANARGSMRNINLGLPALETGYRDDKLDFQHKGALEPRSA